MLVIKVLRLASLKRPLACEHLIEHDTERIHISGHRYIGEIRELFRRHVWHRADAHLAHSCAKYLRSEFILNFCVLEAHGCGESVGLCQYLHQPEVRNLE